jgi:hypothetical protein
LLFSVVVVVVVVVLAGCRLLLLWCLMHAEILAVANTHCIYDVPSRLTSIGATHQSRSLQRRDHC